MQTYTVTVFKGTVEWRNSQGQLHRELGPALEFANGDREWYQNDQRHRTDGPASEYADGDCVWYVNGELHREDGPAVEYATGYHEYWINGKELTLAEFAARTGKSNPTTESSDEQVTKKVDNDGTVEYWVNGQLLTKAEFEAQQTKELTVAEVEELLGYRVKIIS